MATTHSSSSRKAKAVSLHIGLNAVSPAAYGGWDGPLAACEFDAKDMADIARSQGMKTTLLLLALSCAPLLAFDPAGPPPEKTMEWTTRRLAAVKK